jgi:hypothetical protein
MPPAEHEGDRPVTITALPFGKHRGAPLADVPTSYLQWLLREAKLCSGLRLAVADELRRAPDDLRRAVRQVRHTLATMLPRNRETAP